MAFTSRADRNTLTFDSSTPPKIGPGSYNADKGKHRTEASYAPFASTAVRTLDEAPPKYTPGPGDYNAVDQALLRHNSKLATESAAFSSRVSRLASNKTTIMETPSPGTYKEGNAWIKNKHRYKGTGRTQRVVYNRAPTAPSVPARHQSYGYEEADTGELVMQGSPEEGHTGRGRDKVGPGDYNPGLDGVKVAYMAKAPGWSMSKAGRGKAFAPKDTPGPGDYQPDDINFRSAGTQGMDVSKIKRSSNFASRVPRPFQEAVQPYNVSPGPGTYAIVDVKQASAVIAPPVEHQFFGSSAKRGFQINKAASLHTDTNFKTPGPGAYNPDKATVVGARRPSTLPGDVAPAFASTVPRFALKDTGLPGTGTYDEFDNYGMASNVTKRLVSRSGAFGSAAARFRDRGKSASTVTAPAAAEVTGPGPTSYDPETPVSKNTMSSSSMFRSGSRRFVPIKSAPAARAGPKDEDAPLMEEIRPPFDPTVLGPGSYPAEDPWSSASIQRKSRRQGNVFISQQDRFGGALPPGAQKSITPGPGRYSHTKERDAFKPFVRQLPGTGFSVQSRRFKPSTTVSPGPGSYEAGSPALEMMKRSFNVTIDELGFY